MTEKVSVLFVCLGNICRSPTAHAVFAQKVDQVGLADQVMIDSAGTADYHIGKAPDARAAQAARGRDYSMDGLVARQALQEDIARFDYVLAMDRSNLEDLQARAASADRHKPQLFMSFAPDYGLAEVPDPYYGGPGGFEQVLDMIEAAADNLIEDIRRRHL